MNFAARNLASVRERISCAARACGRDPSEVTLIAVSKTHGEEAVREAYAAGQRDFGENYAQEFEAKARALADLRDLRWHFIGHLQSNKAKLVAPFASMIETVDSLRLIDELSRSALRHGRTMGCLVQVNVGEEPQKSGCAAQEVAPLLEAVEAAKGLALSGLMTLPPFHLDAQETRVHFRALKALRDAHGGAKRLPHLSMGMSHDFEDAIEEGATIVRVGTAIFGERPRR
jgi:PLP dependent protein